MLSLEPHNRILVIGETGTGKTEFLKREVLAPCVRSKTCVVALDVKDELAVDGVPREGALKGPLPRRWVADQFFQAPRVLGDEHLAIAIVPDERTPEASAKLFRRLMGSLERQWQKGARRRYVVVLPELGFYAKLVEQQLGTAAAMWRDYGICLAADSQRAVGATIGYRSQCDQIVSFAQSEPADIEALQLRTELTDPTFHQRVQLLTKESHRFELWRQGGAASTQSPPGESNGEEKQRRQGSNRQPVHVAKPHQDGVRSDGDAGRAREGEQRDGPEKLDVQVRPARGPQAQDLKRQSVRGAKKLPRIINTKRRKRAVPPPPPTKTKRRQA